MKHWIIYVEKHGFIAREFVDGKPTIKNMFSNDLREVHKFLIHMGMKLQGQDNIGDPEILEYWM